MGTIAKITAGGSTHLVASTCYGTCTTAANTAAKVATIQDSQAFTLLTGVTVHIKMSNNNTVANPTLNVNSTGAKAIMRYGTTAPSTNNNTSWYAGSVVSFTYDGTYWQMNDFGLRGNDNTTYSAGTGLSLSTNTFNHSNSVTAQTTQAVYPIKIDAQGHISAYGTAVTIPAAVAVKGNSESSYRTGNVNLTAANIGAAASSHTHGNIQNGGTLQTNDITIASGDKLVVTDSSNSSKVARASLSFGTSTTTFLRNDGTWATAGGGAASTITENTTFNISGTEFKINLVT